MDDAYARGRADERADVLAHFAGMIAGIGSMLETHKIGADEATLLTRRLNLICEAVELGLHEGDAQ